MFRLLDHDVGGRAAPRGLHHAGAPGGVHLLALADHALGGAELLVAGAVRRAPRPPALPTRPVHHAAEGRTGVLRAGAHRRVGATELLLGELLLLLLGVPEGVAAAAAAAAVETAGTAALLLQLELGAAGAALLGVRLLLLLELGKSFPLKFQI